MQNFKGIVTTKTQQWLQLHGKIAPMYIVILDKTVTFHKHWQRGIWFTLNLPHQDPHWSYDVPHHLWDSKHNSVQDKTLMLYSKDYLKKLINTIFHGIYDNSFPPKHSLNQDYSIPRRCQFHTTPGDNEGRDMLSGQGIDNGASRAVHHQHHCDDQCHSQKHQADQEKEAQQMTSRRAPGCVWLVLHQDGCGQPQPVRCMPMLLE